MSKRAIIIIFLIILSVFVIFLLIFTSKPVAVNKGIANKKVNTVDLVKLEKNYRSDVKKILVEYERSIGSSSVSSLGVNDNNQTASTSDDLNLKDNKSVKIAELKKELLDLTVPPVSALMDLHVKLVLAFSKMENYLTTNDLKEYEESTDFIKLAKSNYKWLN